jgi:cytochrome c biogenesis protein CcdA
MRVFVFTIAFVFIAALGVGTVLDIQRNGVTVISVIAVIVFGVIMVGVVGALGSGPRR